MSRFQDQKKHFAALFSRPDWLQALQREVTGVAFAKGAANSFLALLNRVECRWQAAYGLGLCVSLMAAENMETARVFMRRLMWNLNEESGNLGWGIPEAMGCILAATPPLADEYARIFISYGYQTGKDDNFLDHVPLRRGVYWGIGRLAQTNALRASPAMPHLVAALRDEDGILCAFAAWALLQLAVSDFALADEESGEGWKRAADELGEQLELRKNSDRIWTPVEYFDGAIIVTESLAAILERALAAIARKG